MNLAEVAIKNRVVTLVLTAVMLLGGLSSYQGMSRLEDPEFTIKDALVVTPYSGASAAEVEEEVTDRIEIAVQALGQLDEIESKSDRGVSNLTVTIKNRYDRNSLPQVWDELRRKVGDVQQSLPPGAGPSLVIDDYGDVFGVFFAVYGDEFSYAELKNVVGLKWSTGLGYMAFERAVVRFADRLSVIDNQLSYVTSHMIGARGIELHPTNYWPQWGVRTWELLESGRYVEAQKELIRVVMPFYVVWEEIAKYTSGDGHLDKLCLELVGLGSSRSRPPTRDIRDQFREPVRQMMVQCGVPGVIPAPAS